MSKEENLRNLIKFIESMNRWREGKNLKVGIEKLNHKWCMRREEMCLDIGQPHNKNIGIMKN